MLIHLLSQSESLPILNRSLLIIFRSIPTAVHKAHYLTSRHPLTQKNSFSRCLKYPVCTIQVILQIQFLYPSADPKLLQSCQLPKRLFSSISSSSFEMIKYLLEFHSALADSHGGYPLLRAIVSDEWNLVRLLLNFGADPSKDGGKAVMVCLTVNSNRRKKGLINQDEEKIRIKLLLERSTKPENASCETNVDRSPVLLSGSLRKRKPSSNIIPPSKRKRLEDRVQILPEMVDLAISRGSWSVVQFFLDKGEFKAIPNRSNLKFPAR
jgi:hypothetical protein